MSVPNRVAGMLMAPAFLLGLAGTVLAAPSASIEQVRNGPPDAPTTPTPTWATGNAGASNSHYLESHSIAYRTVMKELPTDGTVVEIVVGYDVKSSSHYALDYLTHYQRLLPHVLFGHSNPEVFDPLSGVAGVSTTVTTAPIPIVTQSVVIDPDGAEPEPAAPQPATSMASLPAPERAMTLFGGTLIDVSYDSEGSVALATKSSETKVRIRFTADSPTAVLAWGGHIASRWDWGFNGDSPRSAGGIKGSSYHMRLVDWNLGNLGNQDRSMSTDAVYPVPRCMISNAGPFCAGTTNTHTAPEGMEGYSWALFDNSAGAYIVGGDTGTSIQVHAPLPGSYSIMLTTTASGFMKECQTTVLVTSSPTVDAGADLVSCADNPQVQLSGSVVGGTGTWSGGNGSFNPSASALNAIYTPSAAEIAAGGVTLILTGTPTEGPCPPAQDQVHITIDALPTAAAGPDQVACASSPTVQLAGQVGGAVSGGTWSGGAGTFNPNASTLNATYTPTAGEIAAGSVTLTLTTDDPSGPCGPVADNVRITFAPAAIANAGPDQIVCASAPDVQLAGSLGGGATGGSWSGGAGRFRPNANALDATYEPTAGEIAAGQVTLTLTAVAGSGPCPPVSDQMVITIDPITVVDAGPNQTVCASSPQVQLAGSVSGVVSGGVWTGGNGNFNPNRNALDAVYTPSAGEIAAGTVTLTLTSAASGRPCPPDEDAVTITINPVATVNAGPDQITCASSPVVQLAGSVGGSATGATWSGGGGTFSPNPSTLNATYTPTAGEVASGSVTLTLTTNDPAGPCPPVNDKMKITYDAPRVNLRDRVVCTEISRVTLCADVQNGVPPYRYLWSTRETTRCIEADVPGHYFVGILDAIGCKAQAEASTAHRDCEGLVAHTSTTCSSFIDGTADGLDSGDLNVQVTNGTITGIAPGVFFYWTIFTAPSASFTVDLVQTKSNPSFPFIELHQGQVNLFDQNCGNVKSGVESGPGQARIQITGAQPGQAFIASVKYNLKSLIGTYMPPGSGCQYDFKTVINGLVVDEDPDGLQIGTVATVGIGDEPPIDMSQHMLYRPMPNPFQNGMRMWYAVAAETAPVDIRVYDVSGRLIRTLVSATLPAGTHVAEWDGRDDQGRRARKGTYFVHARVGDQARQVRVTFLR